MDEGDIRVTDLQNENSGIGLSAGKKRNAPRDNVMPGKNLFTG